MTEAAEAIVEFTGVSAGYGQIGVLRGVSWRVLKGTVTGLLGPNGAGKTTILRTISGQTTMTDGSVRVGGRDITGGRPADIARLGVAHVVEGRGILRGMSVLDNLLIGAYGRRARDLRAGLDEVYELFPRLRERTSQRADTLSGGEQQMLAIGRGLMMDPIVMLLDEPSQGLSPLMVDTVLDSIRVVRERGVTIVIVEQSPDLLARLVDQVTFVAGGRVSPSMPSTTLSDSALLTSVLAHGILPASSAAPKVAPEAVGGDSMNIRTLPR